MRMLSLKELDLTDKRVLMRVDFNVPIKEGKITDDTRIRAALPTIEYVIEQGGKLILMSHLGRPKGKRDDSLSLKPVAQRLGELLKKEVKFGSCCVGEEVEQIAKDMKKGDVLLLENLRFHPEEEANDPEHAKKLASLGEIYVNDAFGTAHRAHASTEGAAHYFDLKAPGFLMERELDYLSDALESPDRPFVAILGGAKLSDKIPVVENLIPKIDKILLGGGMAFTFLKAKGYEIGDSIFEEDKLSLVHELLEKGKGKIFLPSDIAVGDKFEESAAKKEVDAKSIPSGWRGLDIGPNTIKKYVNEIRGSKTIVWNGPMGVFEFDRFSNGTEKIAATLTEETIKGACTIIGGGDTISAIKKFGLEHKVTHISTGGGASLQLLAGKKLPGVEALKVA
jgi:3-phosphoglycerate kinase